jgi:hypothetical protein
MEKRIENIIQEELIKSVYRLNPKPLRFPTFGWKQQRSKRRGAECCG